MSPESRVLIREAILVSFGDDFEMANAIYGRMSDRELDGPCFQPGKTNRQSWDQYKADRASRQRALDEFDLAFPENGQ